MTAYKVTVFQRLECDTINDDGTHGRDATFTEYVKTMKEAYYTVGRFRDVDTAAESKYRSVSRIEIEKIWIRD